MIKLDKSKLVMNLAKRDKLISHLEKAIADAGDDEWTYTYKGKEPDEFWHPSGHCTLPPSELYHIATAPPSESERVPSISLRKAFQVGHFWHQWLQHLVVTYLHFATEADIEKRILTQYGDGPFEGLTGAIDIANCTTPRWKGIVDFKTMNANDFKYAKEKHQIPEWIRDKYECQIVMYLDGAEEAEGLIIPIQKDSPHEMLEFLYENNPRLSSAIWDKFQFVSECVERGVPPTAKDDEEYGGWIKECLQGPVKT